MSEKANEVKRKERGLNVRVTQEKKTAERDDVRVNSYFEKNDSKKKQKNTTAKKTTTAKKKTVTKKKTSAKKKNTTKNVAAKKKVEVKERVEAKGDVKAEKIEVKKGVEVRKDVKAEKIEVKEKVEDKKETKAKAEKIEVKREVARPKEKATKVEVKLPASFSRAKKPIVILPNKSETEAKTETDNFETLSLGTASTYTSKIIPRDVARNRAEIENPKTLISTFKPEKTGEVEETKKIEKTTAPVFRRQIKQTKKLSAKEIKEREIKKAINTASRLPETSKKRTARGFGNLGWARLTLMITCITTAIFALVYFMNLASNDVTLQVAAAQSGIDATYPDYVPRGYELSDVTSASGKVTMTFKNEDGSFVITEEASSWDSNALLNNYIRENYDEGSYSVVTEQGLTIYMGTNWEAWVNGGLLYKLNVKTGYLTKKQLKTIATSL